MKFRKLGSSDLEVSEISIGSWLTYGVGVEADKARACLEGRQVVTVDDALEMAPYVLTHRLICEEDMTPEQALRMAIETPLI